jgi:hypothetical protein
MRPINEFLVSHGLRLLDNPCVSPDFCLDWPALASNIEHGRFTEHVHSRFRTEEGTWTLISDEDGDHAWSLLPEQGTSGLDALDEGLPHSGRVWFPATFENLIRMKNIVLAGDPGSTIFPSASNNLGKSTLGVGARFTTLHWPAVFWTMKQLGIGLTANQNSIPRELVYDVGRMLAGELETVPFPFIGARVPEGHQGQSVQGMSHGAIIENLRCGFFRHRIPWSFNADHQPVGGAFDSREDALVAGCLFASYITFDLSPELGQTEVPASPEARRDWVAQNLDEDLVRRVSQRSRAAGSTIEPDSLHSLLCYVTPALRKMQIRDAKYRRIREETFGTAEGRAYLRELSIDELPGITAPETTAVMLALCEAMEMPVQFVAPAFGFQKNAPYPDNRELERFVSAQWRVCEAFGVSIGFHSGSGKSAENYRVLGRVTGSHLEIKTSGRYTYEMGKALVASRDPADQALWHDWFEFTVRMALHGAFSDDATERSMAQQFITKAYESLSLPLPAGIFEEREVCRSALRQLPADPDLMFWFEYNFLFVLAAEGKADKASLGDHSPVGYRQRQRFYRISDEARLGFAKRVASYLIFLAEETELADPELCGEARARLEAYRSLSDFVRAIV